MERQIFAYLLFALLVAAAAGGLLYLRLNSPERLYRRRKQRERQKRLADTTVAVEEAG